jgi:magnesium-transporting ATPase (P-type)
VLTGDKKETAISIAYSSALLNNDMERVEVLGTTEEDVSEELKESLEIAR